MILEVLSFWQVIAACLLIMFVLPLIFYLASFDKRPPKIKRRPVERAAEKEVSSEEQESEPQSGSKISPDL
jgi:hypothetical protein